MLALAGAGAVLLAAGLYAARQWQLDQRALDYRETGRAAMEEGDYEAGLDGIGRYLNRFGKDPSDAEDWYLYARARRRVEAPGRKHVTDAIRAMRRSLALDPTRVEAREELLELFIEAGHGGDALDTVSLLLEDDPSNVSHNEVRVQLLTAMGQYDEALVAAETLNRVAPDDLGGHLTTLSLMVKVQRPRNEIRDWADAVAAAHPGDKRFVIVRGSAYAAIGEDETARECLDEALQSGSTDPIFVRILVRRLDEAGRFQESLALLEKTAFDSDAPALERELHRRLWHAGRYEDLERRSAGIGPEPGTDTELVALKVMTLQRLGRRDAAAPLLDFLESEADTDRERAWVRYLRGAAAPGDSARSIIDNCRAALALDDSNEFVLFALGNAYASLKEIELAIETWVEAAAVARDWAAPRAQIARAFLATGREHLSVGYANAAYLRAPSDVSVLGTWVNANARNARAFDAETVARLRSVVGQIQEQLPGEERTLPVYVRLLAGSDPDAAGRRVRGVLASDSPPGEATLIRLARAVESTGLGLEAACFDLSERVHGLTPSLAFARSAHRVRTGSAAAGIAVMRHARAGASDDRGAEWDTLWARLLELAGHADAAETWAEIADAHPDVLDVQLAALSSPSAWDDLEAIGRVIGRTRTLTGEDGLSWRVAEAQLVLHDPDAEDADVAHAAAVLNDVVKSAVRSVQPRLLLAAAMERLGNLEGAREQLGIAAQLVPPGDVVGLELARIAQLQGDLDIARQHLERFLRHGRVAPGDAGRAAQLLYRQGNVKRAAEVLEQAASERPLPRRQSLQLARYLGRLGRHEQAIAICRKWLAEPDADSVTLAAALYTSSGQPERAAEVLARLDELDIGPGRRAALVADHHFATGDADAAIAVLRGAAKAHPDDPDAWAGLLRISLLIGNESGVRDALVRAAATEGPGSGASYLQEHEALVFDALPEGRLRPLLMTLLADPPSRDAVRGVLETMVAARSGGGVDEDTVLAVAEVAEANPTVMGLQSLAARLYAEQGRHNDALAVAYRARRTFPQALGPVRQRAQLLLGAGRWSEALKAGKQWRERLGRSDVYADLLIAEAALRLGRAAEALDRVDGYVPAASENPDQHEGVLLTYTWALLETGGIAKAEELLGPLAARSARWRNIWLSLDADLLAKPKVAERWLRSAEPHFPADDESGRIRLARGWHVLSRKSGDAAHIAKAVGVLEGLAKAGRGSATVHVSLGMLLDEAGRKGEAKDAYVRALELEGALPLAKNNLAMLLADEGDWKRAVKLAREARSAQPGNAEFIDTLAYAHAKGREFDEALACYREAQRLEPDNLRWEVSQAETLAEWGKADDARKLIDALTAQPAKRARLTPALQERVEALRSILGD